MSEKLTSYLNCIFAPYDGVKSINELKIDLLNDLQENIEQTIREMANISPSLERQVVTNLSMSNLSKSDFSDITAS